MEVRLGVWVNLCVALLVIEQPVRARYVKEYSRRRLIKISGSTVWTPSLIVFVVLIHTV
jgi:hypothetical protein